MYQNHPAFGDCSAHGAAPLGSLWENGALETSTIQCHRGGVLPIKSPVPLTIAGGEILKQPNKNSSLQPMDAGLYLNHSEAALPVFEPNNYYTYYVETEVGEKIKLKTQ